MTDRNREPDENADPQRLRALAHPLRWKLIDLLHGERTATATRCAEVLGESVASCSYHLNFLAKYGYVEQAPGGRGRQKPWRLTSVEQDLSYSGGDPAGEVAARTATEVFLDHELDRLKRHLRGAEREPEQWRRATALGGVTVPLTVRELREVSEALREILLRHAGRASGEQPAPPDAREVRVFFSTSVAPPRDGSGSGEF